MRTRSQVVTVMVAALLWGTVPYPARGQDRRTPDSNPPAAQRKDGAKKGKKAGVTLLLTGVALVAGGSYLATTWKMESSGSLMNCTYPPASCYPGGPGWPTCNRTYCSSDFQLKEHRGRLYGGVGLIGAGAVAVFAGIRRLL